MITMKDVCKQLNNGDARLMFGDFLDDFFRNENPGIQSSMIEEEPVFCKAHIVFLAEMAAAVHKLAQDADIPVPKWVFSKKYFLDSPTYAFHTKNPDYQNYLRETTPKEYALRNIYLGTNILKRV